MENDLALAHVIASMQSGAELRLQVARKCGTQIVHAARIVTHCLRSGGKVLCFGNGGSAADAQHLAAELVGHFQMERKSLPGIALTTDSSILTAIGNDYGFDQVFSRQIQALGQPGDVAIGISTSGNSPNVVLAIQQAASREMRTIGLAGRDGGKLAKCAEIPIVVACENTARVQECHISIAHILCELLEKDLLADNTSH